MVKDILDEIFVEKHPPEVYKKIKKQMTDKERIKLLKKEIIALKKRIKSRDKAIKTLRSVLDDYVYGYENLKNGLERLLKYGNSGKRDKGT